MTDNKMSAFGYSACEMELLQHVYQLLTDGNVLGTPQSSNIVDFKYPEELKVIIPIECKIDYFILF